MKTEEQLSESIERFREVFWEKRSTGRPPVGVVSRDIFLPIKYLRTLPKAAEFRPEDVTSQMVMTDYEFGFAHARVSCDDFIPFSAPWRGIPWLEACCGCPVRYSSGSLAPGHFLASSASLADVAIPAANGWFDCLKRETERLEAAAPGDCWISPSILRGPSDVIAAMRGESNFFCDLYDAPGLIGTVAGRVNRLLLDALDAHFLSIPPKRGGYGHIFGYWAPGKTVVLQEDVMGLCSPSAYRDIFWEHNAAVVERLGRHVLFHLHSIACRHYRHVLSIPGLAGLEITVESKGPSLLELVPLFREILEQSRLIVLVDHGFEQLREALRRLPSEGLYLIIPDDAISSDGQFREFVAANWGARF